MTAKLTWIQPFAEVFGETCPFARVALTYLDTAICRSLWGDLPLCQGSPLDPYDRQTYLDTAICRSLWGDLPLCQGSPLDPYDRQTYLGTAICRSLWGDRPLCQGSLPGYNHLPKSLGRPAPLPG